MNQEEIKSAVEVSTKRLAKKVGCDIVVETAPCGEHCECAEDARDMIEALLAAGYELTPPGIAGIDKK